MTERQTVSSAPRYAITSIVWDTNHPRTYLSLTMTPEDGEVQTVLICERMTVGCPTLTSGNAVSVDGTERTRRTKWKQHTM